VRIELQTSGGIAYFPGLARPVTVDSGNLPAEQAADLERQVEAARFFDLPAVVGGPSRGAADYRQYTLTVEASGKRHTVHLTDPVSDPALQALLQAVQDQARAQRAADSGQDAGEGGDPASP